MFPIFLVKAVLFCVFFLYIIIPIALKLHPWFVNHIVFVNMIRWPPFIDFNHPQDVGLNNTRQLKLPCGDVSLGVWHTLPESLAGHEYSLNTGHPVFIYNHGNTGTRAGYHRVELYKKLSASGFHVVSYDYRGYGDSTGSPTEFGVTVDAVAIYEWVSSQVTNAPIFLWGHSLGTAVTVLLLKHLHKIGVSPTGVILEAPFNNLRSAASRHPFTFIYRYMPGFDSIFLDSLDENNVTFRTDKHIADIISPLLILHAKDDRIVPHELGYKLYVDTLQHREGRNCMTLFVDFDAYHRYGHKHIYRDSNLLNIIQKFTKDSINWWATKNASNLHSG